MICIDEDLSLDRLSEEDVPSLVRYLNDRSIYERTLTIPFPYAEADAQKWLGLCRTVEQREGQPAHFAIRDQQFGLIGVLGFDDCTIGKSHKAEVGYWLGQPFRGRGITTRAVAAACEHAFRNFQLEKITAGVYDFNEPSKRVLLKCGFQLEGLLRQWGIQVLPGRTIARRSLWSHVHAVLDY